MRRASWRDTKRRWCRDTMKINGLMGRSWKVAADFTHEVLFGFTLSRTELFKQAICWVKLKKSLWSNQGEGRWRIDDILLYHIRILRVFYDNFQINPWDWKSGDWFWRWEHNIEVAILQVGHLRAAKLARGRHCASSIRISSLFNIHRDCQNCLLYALMFSNSVKEHDSSKEAETEFSVQLSSASANQLNYIDITQHSQSHAAIQECKASPWAVFEQGYSLSSATRNRLRNPRSVSKNRSR